MNSPLQISTKLKEKKVKNYLRNCSAREMRSKRRYTELDSCGPSYEGKKKLSE